MSKKITDKAADAAERHGRDVGGRIIHAAAPYTPPWLLGVSALPVAAGMHSMFGYSPGWDALLGGTGVVLSVVTWESASKRSVKTRIHSALSTAMAAGWLTAAAITGVTRPELQGLVLGGGALAASWNIRRATRNTGRDEEGGGDGGLFEKVRLAGIKIRHTKVEPNKVTVGLQLPGGKVEPEDVHRAKRKIAGALGVPANGVRTHEDPDRADWMEMTIVPKDVLKDALKHPGPSAPGTTMAHPLVIGISEDTVEAMIYAAAAPREARNLAHLMIMGMPGSGKSEGGRDVLAEIATRSEVSVWAIDVVKREQTLGCARGLLDWFATSRAQADAMLTVLPAVISARTDYLASRDMDNWEPGCGLSFLVIWIEEASSIVRDSEAFVELTATARSAGVWVVASLQRASHTNMPTDARANIGQSLCFGTRDLTDAGFALPEEVIEAGADPSKWKANKPGYAYAVGPGIPEERYTTPIRTFRMSPAELTAVINDYAHLRDELDPVTTMAAGQAYRDRTPGVVPGAAPAPAPAPAAVPTGPAPASPAVPAAPAPTAPAMTPAQQALLALALHQEQQAAPGPTGTQVVTSTAPAGPRPDLLAQMLAAIPEDVRASLPALDMPLSPEPELFQWAQLLLDQGQELPASRGLAFGSGDEDEEDGEEDGEESGQRLDKEPAEAEVRKLILALAAEGREQIEAADFAELLGKIKRSRSWLLAYLKILIDIKVLAKGGTGQYRILRENLPRELAER